MNETVKTLKRSFQTYLDNTDNDIISLLLTRDALEELVKALSENKGEWIRMGEAYVCSRCSTTCACTETADKWIWHTDDKFCRGCGAKMKGGKE